MKIKKHMIKDTIGITLLVIATILAIADCKDEKKQEVYDIKGDTYSGVIPCADCEGIAYKLSLKKDNKYEASSVYLGKTNSPFIEKGSWSIKQDSLLILEGDSKRERQFAIHGEELVMLNKNGKRVSGSLAQMYVLQKNDSKKQQTSREKLREQGIDFRATGNEPFWSLSIDFDKVMSFDALNGDSIQTPVPEMKQDTASQARIMNAKIESGSLKVKLYPVGCQDDMSGEIFDYQVTVETNSKSFNGCGNFITPKYKLHDFWSLYSLNGTEVTDKTKMRRKPALKFDVAKEKVFGNTGCNQFNGGFTLSDDHLSFSKMASTKMACPGEMELRFMKALNAVQTYQIVNQELLLMAKNDTLMTFHLAE